MQKQTLDQEQTLDSWEQFDEAVRALETHRAQMQNDTSSSISEFLFRGQREACWPLETTLDRFFLKRPSAERVALASYYEIVLAIKPHIETFTDAHWNIPCLQEYEEWLTQVQQGVPLLREFKAYDYLAYLRHHGFPSPLLDWTQSPYIAAFFAFNGARGDTGYVSVFAYCEYAGRGKRFSSDQPSIDSLGPYVRVHRRHFLQQSQYTICTVRNGDGIYYARHEGVFAQGEEHQDLLWKINLPKGERRKALAALHRMNINAFSLFGTEDSLMDTLATTEIFLKE